MPSKVHKELKGWAKPKIQGFFFFKKKTKQICKHALLEEKTKKIPTAFPKIQNLDN